MALGGLGLVLLFLLAALWPSWASMARIWWHTTTFHHGFLIAPIALALVWRLRHRLAAIEPRQEPLALPALLGLALLWLLGRAAEVQLVQHAALVGLVVAATVALLGRAVGRVLLFPLLFLFFMVPFGEGLVPSLQDFTARFAVALLRLTGVPVYHDGILIETPSGLFEVAEACAGIRFLIANLVVATLFAHLAFRRAWKWVLFLTLAVIVPILANGLRAFGIIWIAYHTDNAYAAGIDHLVYGWGFFTAIMLLLLLIGRGLADQPATGGDPPSPAPVPRRPWRPAFVLAVLAVLAAGPTYARLAMQPPADARIVALPMPGGRAPWREAPEAPEAWRPALVVADLEVQRAYLHEPDGRRVDLHVAFYAFERQGAEAVNQANRLADGRRWVRTAGGRETLAVTGLPEEARAERLAGAGGREQRLVLWWYWVDGTFTTDPLHAKLLQVRGRLLGHAPAAAIVAVSTELGDGAQGDARAAIEGLLGSGGVEPAAYLTALAEAGR
jgi:exosortase A